MRLTLVLLIFFLLTIFVVNVSAAIYKWVDKDGTVHFTDTPPPTETEATVVTPQPNRIEGYGKTSGRDGIGDKPPAPIDSGAVSRDLPIVEMFVTSWCGYCKKAEAYFRARNIPFITYDIEKDQRAAARKASLTNSRGVPFVLIGDVGIPGYSEAAFERALKQYQ